MGARQQLPDDGKNRTREPNPAPAEPRTRGGERPERYPPVKKDDSVQADEGRSFEGEDPNPEPRRGAGGAPDPSVNQGHMGPGGDPAEGKR